MARSSRVYNVQESQRVIIGRNESDATTMFVSPEEGPMPSRVSFACTFTLVGSSCWIHQRLLNLQHVESLTLERWKRRNNIEMKE